MGAASLNIGKLELRTILISVKKVSLQTWINYETCSEFDWFYLDGFVEEFPRFYSFSFVKVFFYV